MKFFHVLANGRRNRNFIPNVSLNGSIRSDPKEIGKVFADKFQQLFGKKRDFRVKVDFQKLLANKTPVDLSQLDRPFSLEEVKSAIFELGRDKTPGPDGFPLHFFQTILGFSQGRPVEPLCGFFLWYSKS